MILGSQFVCFSRNMNRGKVSGKDFISDLPDSITASILTKLPIRDAVRTIILCTRWRYQRASMTQLVFDDKLVNLCMDKETVAERFVNFVLRFLLFHDGPVEKCKIYTLKLRRPADLE